MSYSKVLLKAIAKQFRQSLSELSTQAKWAVAGLTQGRVGAPPLPRSPQDAGAGPTEQPAADAWPVSGVARSASGQVRE
ncbi:hypothetical protein [Streptomyces sp. NPDC002889]|uniref:hypothetical protein n=1 Tax=Streptomyces sp. NPDC002889 TaxID=3364669 RepID=UPI0036AA22B3